MTHLKFVEDGKLIGKLRERLDDGGCAAVIRNTIHQKGVLCLTRLT